MDTLIARGGQRLQLDRERIVFFPAEATFELVQHYKTINPVRELYTADPDAKSIDELELRSMDVLIHFLKVGLEKDAKEHGETVPTLEQARAFIAPYRLSSIFSAVVVAWMNSNAASPAGKAEAETAWPAAPAVKLAKPRSKRRTTSSPKRSESRSVSSGGRRGGSGGRRSGAEPRAPRPGREGGAGARTASRVDVDSHCLHNRQTVTPEQLLGNEAAVQATRAEQAEREIEARTAKHGAGLVPVSARDHTVSEATLTTFVGPQRG